MAGFDLPERVPPGFKGLNGLTTFADEPPPALDADIESRIRAHTDRVIAAVRETVFPRFGLA